jgi:uroporphyrinogen III methyltransferase / synthase
VKKLGKVYLVGAGPGDPALLTLRGKACLERADLVLYDYLVNPQILEHVPPTARLECLGRHGQGKSAAAVSADAERPAGQRIVPQDEINRRLVAEAQAGHIVVRLKGGDPAVFARGAEEVEALVSAGIDFEIVPGITVALAAGSYAGIPITHRELASGVALVTGQEGEEKATAELDYAALAAFPGTLVLYMGVTTAPQWSAALLANGKDPATPAAVIRRCSWPDQQIIVCTLAEIPEVLAPGKLRPPVIVILGSVVALSEKFSWFQHRPLFGQTVLVTRPLDQARELREKLAELGANVLIQPAIEITEPADWSPVDRVIERLTEFDWLVFSSANGVRYFFERLFASGRDMRALGTAKLATIGPATAEALAQYHLQADLQPDEYRAESLAEALAASAKGQNFLLLRASRGREILCEQLTAAGASVEQVVVYESRDVGEPEVQIATAMQAGRIDWTTATSSAIARSLVDLFGSSLHQSRLLSISPLTSSVLQERGFRVAAEATEYTTDGMVAALLASVESTSKLDL